MTADGAAAVGGTMPANDERDPLDEWLSQQVRPLPPPPGTFELIARRARRRKARKLLASAAGTAVVAAAIAVAVPGGLVLKVSPPPVAANSEGSKSPIPSGGGSQSVNGTAGSASTSPSASTSAPVTPQPAEPSGPVPDNFQPTSVTFVSSHTGWVIGQAGTPGKCANKSNPYICTSVARTDNAGRTWQGGPAPETTGPDAGGSVAAAGVSQIRFLDGVHGWAYGPGLWVTHDDGNHWHPVNTKGHWVITLETARGRAFAVWASCPRQASQYLATGDVTGCTSYTLMSTAADSDNWQPVGAATTGLTAAAAAEHPVALMLSGSAGYLYVESAGKPTVYSGPLDGTWKQQGTLPCDSGQAPSQRAVALAGAGNLAALCPDPTDTSTTPPGKPPVLWRSADGGATWSKASVSWPSPAPVMPEGTPEWVITSLAAAPNGTLVLATTSGLYVLPAGSNQWKLTNAAGKAAPSGGFSYVGMTTNEQGVAVPKDSSLHEIWMTFDGGVTWAPATPILPGK